MRKLRRGTVSLASNALTTSAATDERFSSFIAERIAQARSESKDCDGSCNSCAVRSFASSELQLELSNNDLAKMVEYLTSPSNI